MGMRDGTAARRRQLYLEAIAMIEARYAEPLTVEIVARGIAASRRQLQRAFEEAGHTSFRDYLTRVRIAHATRLLATTPAPVQDVGRRVGYTQPAHFAKTFRRHAGQSPREYRRGGVSSVA